jgi:hypothetical protein
VFPDANGAGWRDRLVDGSRSRRFSTLEEAVAAARLAIANAGGGELTINRADGTFGSVDTVPASHTPAAPQPSPSAVQRAEFQRAVLALRKSFAPGYSVTGRRTTGNVEISHRGRLKVYRMLPNESAWAFCERICRVEPDCDTDRIRSLSSEF